LTNNENHFFCIGSVDLSPVFFVLFFSAVLVGYQRVIEILNGSFESFFSRICTFCKSRHLQVPYGTKMVFLCHFSRGGISRLPQYRRQIFSRSYKGYCSYLRPTNKFHHQKIPNGSKNGTFGAMFQLEKLWLVGYQNFEVIFNVSFESYCSYIRDVYQFYHSEV